MKFQEKEIPEDQLVEFTLSSDSMDISPPAQETIKDLIRTATLSKDVFYRGGLDWRWKTMRGTLPKRLDSWYYKKYQKSLGDKLVSEIGNIARKDIPKDQVYNFDITRKLDWAQGEFGDAGSCFFTSDKKPSGSIEWMKDRPHRYAIRFFKKFSNRVSVDRFADKFYKGENYFYIGLSRAWLTTKVGIYNDYESVVKDVIAIHNGYGFETKLISNVLSSYLQPEVSKCLTSHSDIDINHELSYAMGPQKSFDGVEELYLY